MSLLQFENRKIECDNMDVMNILTENNMEEKYQLRILRIENMMCK